MFVCVCVQHIMSVPGEIFMWQRFSCTKWKKYTETCITPMSYVKLYGLEYFSLDLNFQISLIFLIRSYFSWSERKTAIVQNHSHSVCIDISRARNNNYGFRFSYFIFIFRLFRTPATSAMRSSTGTDELFPTRWLDTKRWACSERTRNVAFPSTIRLRHKRYSKSIRR